MSNIVEIVHEMSDNHYFVSHKWLVDTMPVLARMLEWQSKFGQEKCERQILHLPKDVFFGKMTQDLLEHLIEYACCSHYGRSPFDVYLYHINDMNRFPWKKLSTIVGLADFLGVEDYVDELCPWMGAIEISLWDKNEIIEWFGLLLQAYHDFVYCYPEDHDEIAYMRKCIVSILGEQSKYHTCSCRHLPEIPEVNKDFFLLAMPGNQEAVSRYWKDMEQCTLTTLFKQSQWTVNTLASFVIDIDHHDFDIGPHCGNYTFYFILLIHYWLAKGADIEDVEVFVECTLSFRKSDVQRRRVILESLFRYTGVNNERLQFALTPLDGRLKYLDESFDVATCHNCLNMPSPFRGRRYSPVKCELCHRHTCGWCNAECQSCQMIICFSCTYFFTVERLASDVICESKDLLGVEKHCKTCVIK